MPDQPPNDQAVSEAERILRILRNLPPLEYANVKKLLDKYRNGLTTRREDDKLRALGLIEQTNAAPADDPLPDCDSLKALAACLSRFFEGRIRIDISDVRLCQWKSGRSVPKGVPLPPGRTGNRHNAKAWAEWIENHILPKYGIEEDTPRRGKDLFRRADEAEAEEKIAKSALAKLELKVAQGKYQSVEVYLRGLRDVGAIVNQKLNAIETLLPDHIAALLPEDNRIALLEALREAARIAIDATRHDLANALREAGRALQSAE